MLKKLGKGHRCAIKYVKLFGKHYFQELNKEEYAKWRKTNTGVIYDVRTDEEMIKFALKVKAIEGKDMNTCSVHIYYFPNLNNDEAALMA